MIRYFFALICLISLSSFAEENEDSRPPEVSIAMGGGKVSIAVHGLNLDSSTLDRLQTELLVNPKLVEQITGSTMTTVTLSGHEIDEMQREIQKSSDGRIEKIKNLLLHDLDQSVEPSTRVELGQAGLNVSDGLNKVILGDDFTVTSNEKFENVVVLGGQIRVLGEVQNLLVVGGSALLLEVGTVGNLVVVGGQVKTFSEEQILGDRVVINQRNFGDYFLGWFWPKALNVWNFFYQWLFAFLWAWLAPWVVSKFSPEYFARIRGRQSGFSIGQIFSGFFYMFLFVPVLLGLVISILGILLIPAYLLVVFLLAMFSWGFAIESMGRVFLKKKSFQTPVICVFGALFWVSLGYLPFVGFVVKACFFAVTLAAMSRALLVSKTEVTNT